MVQRNRNATHKRRVILPNKDHARTIAQLAEAVHSLLAADQGQKDCQFRAMIKARKRQTQRHEKLFALAAARKSAEAMVKEQFRQMLRKMVTSS